MSKLKFRADYDETVMAAFQEGRQTDYIWVAYCSACKAWSYWNQGSHCNCRFCGADLESDEVITMADYWADSEYLCDQITAEQGKEADHKEKEMQSHQQRVVQELRELTEKREKLGAFIAGSGAIFVGLPSAEQERLRRQFDIMVSYEGVLQERIDHFQPWAEVRRVEHLLRKGLPPERERP